MIKQDQKADRLKQVINLICDTGKKGDYVAFTSSEAEIKNGQIKICRELFRGVEYELNLFFASTQLFDSEEFGDLFRAKVSFNGVQVINDTFPLREFRPFKDVLINFVVWVNAMKKKHYTTTLLVELDQIPEGGVVPIEPVRLEGLVELPIRFKPMFTQIRNLIKKKPGIKSKAIYRELGNIIEAGDAIQSLLSGNWINHDGSGGYVYIPERTEEEIKAIQEEEPFSGDYPWEDEK